MRMLRFRIKTLMVAVAVVAVLTWGFNLYRLSSLYSYRSASAKAGETEHVERCRARDLTLEQFEETWLVVEGELRAIGDSESRGTYRKKRLKEIAAKYEEGCRALRLLRVREQAIATHYARLKDKYERAARYPWLPIAPDPPLPE